MDNFRGVSLPDRDQRLAVQKMKARVTRQSMILAKTGFQEASLTRKVIKYETFLSHQILSHIKTEQVRQFESEVQQLCKGHQLQSCSDSKDRHLGIQRFLDSIKKNTKLKIQRLKSRRRISEEQQQPSKQSGSVEQQGIRQNSPPSVKNKFTVDLKRKRPYCDRRNKLKTTFTKNNLADLIQKVESMKIPKINPKFNEEQPLSSSIEGEQVPSNKLKKQKERLQTVLENNGNIQFKPIGNVRKQNRSIRYQGPSEKKSMVQIPSISTKLSSMSLKDMFLQSINSEARRLNENLKVLPIHRHNNHHKTEHDNPKEGLHQYVSGYL